MASALRSPIQVFLLLGVIEPSNPQILITIGAYQCTTLGMKGQVWRQRVLPNRKHRVGEEYDCARANLGEPWKKNANKRELYGCSIIYINAMDRDTSEASNP